MDGLGLGSLPDGPQEVPKVVMKKTGVFLGTFQPMHTGHLNDILRDLETVDHLVILVSDFVVRGIRTVPTFVSERSNPFTYDERREMVESTLKGEKVDSSRFSVVPLSEYLRGLRSDEDKHDILTVARNGKLTETLAFALRKAGRFTGTFGPAEATDLIPESVLRAMIRDGRSGWRIYMPDPAERVVHEHLKVRGRL